MVKIIKFLLLLLTITITWYAIISPFNKELRLSRIGTAKVVKQVAINTYEGLTEDPLTLSMETKAERQKKLKEIYNIYFNVPNEVDYNIISHLLFILGVFLTGMIFTFRFESFFGDTSYLEDEI